jgi:hypothetical protein
MLLDAAGYERSECFVMCSASNLHLSRSLLFFVLQASPPDVWRQLWQRCSQSQAGVAVLLDKMQLRR